MRLRKFQARYSLLLALPPPPLLLLLLLLLLLYAAAGRKWHVADPNFIGYTYKNWEAVHSGGEVCALCGGADMCGVWGGALTARQCAGTHLGCVRGEGGEGARTEDGNKLPVPGPVMYQTLRAFEAPTVRVHGWSQRINHAMHQCTCHCNLLLQPAPVPCLQH
jgi:hypothetical protein